MGTCKCDSMVCGKVSSQGEPDSKIWAHGSREVSQRRGPRVYLMELSEIVPAANPRAGARQILGAAGPASPKLLAFDPAQDFTGEAKAKSIHYTPTLTRNVVYFLIAFPTAEVDLNSVCKAARPSGNTPVCRYLQQTCLDPALGISGCSSPRSPPRFFNPRSER